MRTALVTLIALAGLAGSAVAQQPAPPAAPQTPPAPAAAPPAAPPASTFTAPPAATQEGAAPVAPSPAPAPTAEPVAPPTLPTEGDGAAVLSLLQRVCIPAVKGGDLNQLARGAGMKKTRDGGYTGVLGTDKAYTFAIQPPGSNRNVCAVDLRYPVNGERQIVTALNIWAFLHDPELKLQRNDFQVGGDNVKRVTMSWEYYTDKESTGLVFVQLKNADGSSMNARYDSATLLYSERTFP